MNKTQMSELSVEEAITHIKAACKIAIETGYNSVVVDACAMAVEALRSSASPTNCSTCILDNTDACTRGAGRAVDDEACEDYLASPTGAEGSEGDEGDG